MVTRTQRHHKPTGFSGASAKISPSRRAGSNCASQASRQLSVGEEMGLSDSLEMGSHKNGSLWSSRSEVCAPLSTLSPSHVHPYLDGPVAPILGGLQRAQGAWASVLDTVGITSCHPARGTQQEKVASREKE